MADDEVNEDQWLYGDSNPDKSNEGTTEDNIYGDKFDNSQDSNAANQATMVLQPPIIEAPKNFNDLEKSILDKRPSISDRDTLDGVKDKATEEDNNAEREEGEDGELEDNKEDGEEEPRKRGEGDDEDDDEDDDSEDDVNVVIGEIKTSSQYTIKRGGLLSTAAPQLKQPGKFSIEEFETIGTINGVVAHDYSLDSLEDKPWRKPGADITDYFNYGFNEETWRSYCERQKRMRIQESGVGLAQLSSGTPQAMSQAIGLRGNIPVTIVNDNSKYASVPPPPGVAPPSTGMRKAGPPPSRRVGGSIDVLGNPTRGGGDSPPKGNIIQVMTADRREYSRKSGFPDMSVPPPNMPPPNFAPDGFGSDYVEYYNSDMDPYYQAYEPTQDSQWGTSTAWDHDEVKIMPPVYPPPVTTPHMPTISENSNQDSQDASDKTSLSGMPTGVTIKQERDGSKEPDREKDRDRERDRSERERERGERHRERSHRHRSRSRSTERRSRKHKSRSRSPGHRSHKKKKSKKSEKNKEDSE